MNIVLEYLAADDWPRPDGWTVVGRVGPDALAYDEARRPHLIGAGGPEALDPAVVNPALATAVDAAASRLWPGGWGHSMPLAFGVNRRTVSLDRIAKNGLFPDVLHALAFAASDPDAAGVGWLMSGLARYADEHGQGVGAQEDLDDAERASANALAILRSVRRGKVRKPDPDA